MASDCGRRGATLCGGGNSCVSQVGWASPVARIGISYDAEGEFFVVKHPIRFGISCAQQTYEWPQLVELWETADKLGFDSLWTFDHLYPILLPDPSGPCFEGWT